MTTGVESNSSVVAQSVVRVRPERDLVELVGAARAGDAEAWKALVCRYAPLIDSVTRRYRLSVADAQDVSQTVWLRLFQNLAGLRDARALPGWIKTTSQREVLHVLAMRPRTESVDPSMLATLDRRDDDDAVDRDLMRAERDRAVMNGLARLASQHRRLLVLLHAEPRASYQEISEALGIPVGSIGPTRARCLDKLRKTEPVRAWVDYSKPEDFEAA